MKKISRRSFLQVAGAAAAMGALSACGVSTNTGSAAAGSTAGSTAAAGSATEIQWMFWDDLEATEDLISKGYKDVIDRFNEQYNGQYHCTPVTTNLEEYYTKLNALVAANQTPDVFICSPGPNLDVYVNPGVAADLTDILNGAEADWYKTFTDGIFERVT
ncbi:MAG: extracellular solute-binding protein, partial [Faecalibacterium sp.]|nr:extracellular solute-binding protein [Faecalibacterium sp.]